MDIQATDSIDSIVSRNLKAARVLDKYGIDYCSEGDRSVREACREANISFRRLLRNIHEAGRRAESPPDVSSLQVGALTRFIERHHHARAYENLTFIRTNLSRLVRLFGNEHPQLEVLHSVFQDMKAYITVHMQYEEQIVFPYLRALAKHGTKGRNAVFRCAGSPVPAMLADHEKSKPYRRRLDELTHHYTILPSEGNLFKVTYEAMKDFEAELHLHMMIEDEILLPKALELEGRLKKFVRLSPN